MKHRTFSGIIFTQQILRLLKEIDTDSSALLMIWIVYSPLGFKLHLNPFLELLMISISPISFYNWRSPFNSSPPIGSNFHIKEKPLLEIWSSSEQHFTDSMEYKWGNLSWNRIWPHRTSFQKITLTPELGMRVKMLFPSIFVLEMDFTTLEMLVQTPFEDFLVISKVVLLCKLWILTISGGDNRGACGCWPPPPKSLNLCITYIVHLKPT